MKHEARSNAAPDAAPSVPALEAGQSQNRKETEELLAGFDRPGRGLEKAPAGRDFVDYYARPKKKNKKPKSSASERAPAYAAPSDLRTPPQMDIATVITERKREGMPGVAWLGAALLMLLVGGVVAYLATNESHPSAGPFTGPGAATTITAASAPWEDRDVVPPPVPAEPTAHATTTAIVVTEPAAPPNAIDASRASARRESRGTPHANGAGAPAPSPSSPAAATPTEGRKPPPRDDFIRDL